MKKKKIFFIILIFLLFTNVVWAEELTFENDRGILLYEENYGKILFEKNINKKFYPASTTKLMTALLVMENLDLDDEIIVGSEINLITADSSNADLSIGEVIKVKDLLYGLLIESGNDVANTFAVNVSKKVSHNNNMTIEGAISYFVELMNKKASALNAINTHFVNPHGLHDENHYTTPEDIIIIARELLEYEFIEEIVKTPQYDLETNIGIHKWINTNIFLHKKWDIIPYVYYTGENQYYNSQVTGVKTGFTTPAGRCLVFSASNEDLDLLGVIYHSNFPGIWQEGEKLIKYAFENYKDVILVESNEEIKKINVINNNFLSADQISLITKENISVLLQNKQEANVEMLIAYDTSIISFTEESEVEILKEINKGDIIAKLQYSVDESIIAETDLYAGNDVSKRNLIDFLFQWQLIVIYIIILLIYIFRKRK
ncbi:MAG: D-alanyl-D-alanine carboxypeptidase family protein [Eubacteriaceae bacterium]